MDQTREVPWTFFTTAERLIELHGEALSRYGGRPGPDDPSACIDAALGGAYNAELYLEGRPHTMAGLPFAAHLLFYLVKRHCFTDGNKRIAWLAAVDVLASLGLGIVATDDDAFGYLEAVIAGQVETGEQVAAWMANRLHALS